MSIGRLTVEGLARYYSRCFKLATEDLPFVDYVITRNMEEPYAITQRAPTEYGRRTIYQI
jgi:hypothetical protein